MVAAQMTYQAVQAAGGSHQRWITVANDRATNRSLGRTDADARRRAVCV